MPPAVMVDRRRHLAALAVSSVLLVLTVSGCAHLGAALGTGSALRSAGYQNVSVNIATGTGLPADGLVCVSYSRGPTGNDQQDAQHAERIVWDSLSYRFGALVIIKDSGGCAGPVCVSQSGEVASATYAQLAAEFGPRPHGLDTASAAGAISVPGWAVVLGVVLAVAVVAAAAIVLALILRRRRPPSEPPERHRQGR